MPVPTATTVKEYATLSYLAQGYSNNAFIGMELLPLVEEDQLFVKIPIYGPDALRIYQTVRAKYAHSNLVLSADGQFLLVELKEHDIVFPIDLMQTENSEIPKKRRRNTKLAQDAILLGVEKMIADLCQDINTYPEDHRFTLTGTDQWSDPDNSNPVNDVDTLKMKVKSKTGKEPNVIAMGSEVFDTVKNHPKLQTTNTLQQKFPATPETLAQYFGVKKVLVGQSIYADMDNVFQYLWGKYVIGAYVLEKPQGERSSEDRSLGWTIRRKGYPKVDEYDINPGKVIGTRNTDTIVPVITGNICGGIITGVIA